MGWTALDDPSLPVGGAFEQKMASPEGLKSKFHLVNSSEGPESLETCSAKIECWSNQFFPFSNYEESKIIFL